MVKMDITDIQYPDNSFDVISCSHVLEHVPDDRRAMREFNRVLTPDGFALLMVPIRPGEKTFEDPSITNPEERQRLFGRHNHVRWYGLDFKDRLEEEGLSVRVFSAAKAFGAEDFLRLGLGHPDRALVFVCKKGKSK
jgi:SAM-dependent methyltransferase